MLITYVNVDTATENNSIVSDLYCVGRAVASSSLKTVNYCVFNNTSYITLDGLINHSVQPSLECDAVLHEGNATENVRVTGKHYLREHNVTLSRQETFDVAICHAYLEVMKFKA